MPAGGREAGNLVLLKRYGELPQNWDCWKRVVQPIPDCMQRGRCLTASAPSIPSVFDHERRTKRLTNVVLDYFTVVGVPAGQRLFCVWGNQVVGLKTEFGKVHLPAGDTVSPGSNGKIVSRTRRPPVEMNKHTKGTASGRTKRWLDKEGDEDDGRVALLGIEKLKERKEGW